MQIHIKYKKNKHQKEFHSDNTTRFLHLSTGFGGGKTYALCMKAINLSFLNKDISGGILCPTFADYKRDVLPLFEDILFENKIDYYLNRQDNYMVFPWSRGKLFFITAEKKLRGPNFGFALANEVTLMDHVRFKELVGRVRVKRATAPQIATVGTPEGVASWVYEKFIDQPMANSRIIYGNTLDNLDNLDEHYVESLRDSYDSVMQQAYIEGLWVNMTGNRFYYAYNAKKNEKSDYKPPEWCHYHVALDFNVAPMAASVWVQDKGKMYCIDELAIYNHEIGEHYSQTAAMCTALKSRGYTPDSTYIYPDPSGRARSTKGDPDIEILKNEGYFNVRVKKKAPLFRERQLNVNNLFEKGRLVVDPKKAPRTRKDFMAVEQDPIKLEKIKTNKELTHYSDGVDYMCDILYPFRGHPTKSRIERRM